MTETPTWVWMTTTKEREKEWHLKSQWYFR